jgi:nucleoside-diphosphate-sugar epimerase
MDVAKAIEIIVNQPTGENYLICNEQTVGIQQLVLQIYEKAGFILQEHDHIFYESNSQLPIMRIECSNNGLNNLFTNIDGYPTKLKSLGWTPSITTEELIQSIVMNASYQE